MERFFLCAFVNKIDLHPNRFMDIFGFPINRFIEK